LAYSKLLPDYYYQVYIFAAPKTLIHFWLTTNGNGTQKLIE